MPNLKTAEDFRDYLKVGGIGIIEARIERAFSARLLELKEKITRLIAVEQADPFHENLLLTSILVDTRALFLESDRLQRNATLQNVYRARGMEERAYAIDSIFNEKVLHERSMKDIIKAWVDKRVVHMDWLWDDDEALIFDQIEALVFGSRIKSLFEVLLQLIEEYEALVAHFGKDIQEQLEKVLLAMTGP